MIVAFGSIAMVVVVTIFVCAGILLGANIFPHALAMCVAFLGCLTAWLALRATEHGERQAGRAAARFGAATALFTAVSVQWQLPWGDNSLIRLVLFLALIIAFWMMVYTTVGLWQERERQSRSEPRA